MKQMTSAAAADQSGFERHRKPTRRDAFLAEMQTLVPWSRLVALIEPHYPKAGNGRPPIGLERMLRIHLLQHWFNLPDLACEEALHDSTALRAFAGIDLGREPVPDGTTLCKFRHLQEQHQLGQAIFSEVGRVLQERGLKLSAGTIVDATIIAAPSSTKNVEQQRDPEMRQTKKGNQWHFGMKLHIGADSRTGLVHSAVITSANVHDKHPLHQLLRGTEKRVYGDRGYQGCGEIIKAAAPRRGTSRTGGCASPTGWTRLSGYATAPRAARGRGWIIPSWSLSGCGASPRCATGAWPRTPTGPSQRWRW